LVRIPLTLPFSVGAYRCEEIVGFGGWGTVYRAVAEDDSPLAVKVIDSHPDPDEMDRERFERVTARLMALDPHPSVVEVLDAGYSRFADGRSFLWIAMPYVDKAVTLQHRLEVLGSAPSIGWTRKVIASLAAGLHVLHGAQIVHRDLKPENVLILPGDRVVIIDFDVACLADSDRATPLGRPFGTPRYRAPEQLDGECCPASDLWALGVIAYEMYTGSHPFARPGMRDEDLMRAIREWPVASPGQLRPGLESDRDRQVLRLLDKVAWRRGHITADGSLGDGSAWSKDQAPIVSVSADSRGDVEATIDAGMGGGGPAVVVVPASRPTALRAAREQLGAGDVPLAVEPVVAPFAFPDWESRKTLAKLPYRPEPGELYDKRLLDDPRRLREVSRTAVAGAVGHGADRLLAPWTVAREAADLQMLVSLRMLGDTLKTRDETPATARLPVVATVALPIEAIGEQTARVRIANAFAGYGFDAIRLALQGLGWRSSNRQILAALELALLLQESGAPVFVMVSNPLREIFWTAGVAGVEGIPDCRERQSLPGPAQKPGTPRKPVPRFELSSLAVALPPSEAIALLESAAVPEAMCSCAGCAGLDAEQRVKRPVTHNIISMVEGARSLEGLMPPEREQRLRERLHRAERLGRELAAAGAVEAIPPVAARLRNVLDDAVGADLLRPALRRQLRRAG
jgi:serine/threonine protein kinase